VNTAYVLPLNFLAPGSRDMFDANNKAVNYLYHSLCESEFERVRKKDLACRIWEQLKNAHTGNAQVQARLFATYRREYENFTHLPGESIDAMFQRLTLIVNNMRANVAVPPYDDHDKVLTVDYRIKVHMDLQADKSPVIVKGPFFPRVVNPRYRIRGTMCNARIQSSKARKAI
jgi:hypothetical protein